MILEAFQGAIVRNAELLLIVAIYWAIGMSLGAFAVVGKLLRRPGGYQPSSAGGAPTTGIPSGGSSGSRPEPPRSGSGVQAPVDQSARIARLRAELEDLAYAAQGGNADKGNAELLNFFCDHLIAEHGESPSFHYITAARQRARMLEDALKNARDTLETTKPLPSDNGLRKPSGTL